MKKHSVVVFVAAISALSQAVLPTYRIYDVGPWKPNERVDLRTVHVNVDGHVSWSLADDAGLTGHYDPNTLVFNSLWAGSSYLYQGSGINDNWAIAGTAALTNGRAVPTLVGNGWWWQMPLPVNFQNAYAISVNNNYDVAVEAVNNNGTSMFLYRFGIGYIPVPLPAGNWSYRTLWNMNANGSICGSVSIGDTLTNSTGWYWDGTTTYAMPQLSSTYTRTNASDVNDFGVVVGEYGSRACFWFPAFNWLELLPSSGNSQATAINNAGIIVGSDQIGGTYQAVAWEGISPPVPLIGRVAIGGAGWQLGAALDISENGKIVGYGTKNGVTKIFLLKPILP